MLPFHDKQSSASQMKLWARYQTLAHQQVVIMDSWTTEFRMKLLCEKAIPRDMVEALSSTDMKDAHPETWLFLLESCIKSKALAEAHHIHSFILSKGFRLSLFLNTRLVDMYSKAGSIDKAQNVFDGMAKRDVVVWNALIAGYARYDAPESALELFSGMGQDGILPDEATFVAILLACARLGNLDQAKLMHEQMILCGVRQDLGINNTLIDMYTKCGSMADAYGVFEVMPVRSVVSWTAIMAGYSKQGYGKEALNLFHSMKKSGIYPDEVAFLTVINACATIGSLEQGKQIHFLLMESSIPESAPIKNSLLDMYSKCGSMEHAFQVFNDFLEKDLISWSTMITGYGKQGDLEKVFAFYDKMYQAGVNPSEVTFLSIFNACASMNALDEGKGMHNTLSMIGLNSNIVMECTLVDMYAKCGCLDSARGVFDHMERHDTIAWNAMITGYNQQGRLGEAFCLFEQMKVEGVDPDEGTYVNLLNVCANWTTLDRGRQLHANIEKSVFKSDLFISSSLVDMYCKCADMTRAQEVFYRSIPNKCVVIWTAMITGYAQHGLYTEALQFLEKMQAEQVLLNDMSFQKLLSACSYGGFAEQASFIFAYMNQAYGVKPHVEHYTCFVDLLGRVGRLEEAGYVIKEMTCKETPEVWMALLGACRLNGHVELAESAADCILKFMPYNSSAFLLLRDIYATTEMLTQQEKFLGD